ncbi:MAG: GAF domain-containing protein [Gammaproteobacteria bacterium]|nr:GAF domain-containing protein [Gammaproteobacteria bacterium]
MRADRIEIGLGEVSSALGSEGYVFPMAVRGVLRGALACGARSEEYTRDERKLIAEVAHQVGIALHALRARDNEALVKEIASGSLDPSTARKRARELHAAWATDA